MTRLSGFPPVINQHTRVLILGSFPSAASLAAGQYYAHPQNQFWRVLGAVIGQPLKEMPYAARLKAVTAAGIAIWDIYASCERAGSLDSAIARPSRQRLCRTEKVGAGATAHLLQRPHRGGACARWKRWAMKPWSCPRPARPMPA
jgi:G:T/U-mismatch repair DNA glycosylase